MISELPVVEGVRFAIVEEVYAVGDDGSVWSNMDCNNRLPQGWRRTSIHRRNYGAKYCVVCLRADRGKGKVICRYVHRLVLEAFVGECPEGQQCLHGDGDTSNNRVGNLRWGTPKENSADWFKHGAKRGNVKLNDAKVLEILQRRAKGEFQKVIAADLGIAESMVSRIHRRESWKHVKFEPSLN